MGMGKKVLLMLLRSDFSPQPLHVISSGSPVFCNLNKLYVF